MKTNTLWIGVRSVVLILQPHQSLVIGVVG
jgi:hypothetical protein